MLPGTGLQHIARTDAMDHTRGGGQRHLHHVGVIAARGREMRGDGKRQVGVHVVRRQNAAVIARVHRLDPERDCEGG